MSKHTETAGQYPVIPLRTEVQLPGHVGPLEIGREASVRAIEAAQRDDNLIIIIPQKNPAVRDPGQRDLHEVGVRAEIVQIVKRGFARPLHLRDAVPSSARAHRSLSSRPSRSSSPRSVSPLVEQPPCECRRADRDDHHRKVQQII